MAYERIKEKNQLQFTINYGAGEDGHIKKRSKTYLGLSLDEAVATPEAVVKTGEAMGSLMTPLVEEINNVMTYNNVETE